MNKQEALNKIEELKKYVEELDKPKITIDMIKPGAVFLYNGPHAKEPVTLIRTADDRWYMGGCCFNPFYAYSGVVNGVSKDYIFAYVKDDHTYLGMQKTTIVKE